LSAGLEFASRSPDQTRAFGLALGELLRGGECIALSGELGAGKTVLAKGLAEGLGVPADEPVISPTFVLVREYFGRLRLFHIDAYRLRDAAELLDLGWEEMLQSPAAVVAIEWPERVAAAIPAAACRVALTHVGPSERRVRVLWPNRERLGQLQRRI
jgi:tRNA threonylcarbamoyladenosine biosynthesis protein TsaE